MKLNTLIPSLRYAFALLRSEGGRDYGWWIIYRGERIALLDHGTTTAPHCVSYSLRYSERHRTVLEARHSWEQHRFTFLNCRLNEPVTTVFTPADTPILTDGRVTVRGLSLKPRNALERWVVMLGRMVRLCTKRADSSTAEN